ncbi:hypothetical protein NPM20_25785, partial [Vibrio parahaemolyticus]|nr:hypothetical protein [Vibrio parahaemolyticus]
GAIGALKSVAIKGNPLPLNKERLVFILKQVCDCSGECAAETTPHMSSVEVLESRSDLSSVNESIHVKSLRAEIKWG